MTTAFSAFAAWMPSANKYVVQLTPKGITMQPNEPTAAQIDLMRKLISSVTSENAHSEYEKARLQFATKEEFQAALRMVEIEFQHRLAMIEHWHHLASK